MTGSIALGVHQLSSRDRTTQGTMFAQGLQLRWEGEDWTWKTYPAIRGTVRNILEVFERGGRVKERMQRQRELVTLNRVG